MRKQGLKGGCLYWDAQTDDTRLCLEVLKAAFQLGCQVANYMRVTNFVKEEGKITQAVLKDLKTGVIEITAQNHNFAVESKSLEKAGFDLTHRNLNDGTVEGIRHRELPIFSVQYHPEASPGPHDSLYLFNRFYQMMEEYAKA